MKIRNKQWSCHGPGRSERVRVPGADRGRDPSIVRIKPNFENYN